MATRVRARRDIDESGVKAKAGEEIVISDSLAKQLFELIAVDIIEKGDFPETEFTVKEKVEMKPTKEKKVITKPGTKQKK